MQLIYFSHKNKQPKSSRSRVVDECTKGCRLSSMFWINQGKDSWGFLVYIHYLKFKLSWQGRGLVTNVECFAAWQVDFVDFTADQWTGSFKSFAEAFLAAELLQPARGSDSCHAVFMILCTVCGSCEMYGEIKRDSKCYKLECVIITIPWWILSRRLHFYYYSHWSFIQLSVPGVWTTYGKSKSLNISECEWSEEVHDKVQCLWKR